VHSASAADDQALEGGNRQLKVITLGSVSEDFPQHSYIQARDSSFLVVYFRFQSWQSENAEVWRAAEQQRGIMMEKNYFIAGNRPVCLTAMAKDWLRLRFSDSVAFSENRFTRAAREDQ
jgi:hypothetical protein